MSKKASNPPPQGPRPPAPPGPPPLHKAVTFGQVSGLKLIEKDGSWNITVNVQREHVPPGVEQWAFQIVAVAVMKNPKAAEKAMEDDIFGAEAE